MSSSLLSTRLLQRFEITSNRATVAVLDEAGAVTFSDAAARSRALARELGRLGLGGARIGLFADPGRDWVEAFWAIALSGGTAVPLSPLHPPPERATLLAASGARAVLISSGLATSSEAFANTERLVFEGGRVCSTTAGAAQTSLAPVAVAEEHPVLLLYTSGTTGTPKGVPLSHHNVCSGVEVLIDEWALSPRDRLIHTLPLHHLHGICVSLLSAYCAGASTRFSRRFDPEVVLASAETASIWMAVPTQHKRLVDHLDALTSERERTSAAARLRALRLITSGSAKLPEGLGRRLEALSGQYPLERYGMTEVGIVLGNPLAGPRKPGSCGRVLPKCEVRVVDEQGRDVGPGVPGELWIRGPTVFAGYDGDPAATAAAFSGGYFKSGDTAALEADGFVHILGRTSVDIIKSGGYKLSAIELEEQLRGHPWVLDVAVVGVPDETWGERVVAVVIPATGARARVARDPISSERELRSWLKERVAAYRVPKAIVWSEDLPRNALGKVQKAKLRERLAESSPSSAAPEPAPPHARQS